MSLETKTPMMHLIEFILTNEGLTLNKILEKAEELSILEYRMICDAFSAPYIDGDGCAAHYWWRVYGHDLDFTNKAPTTVPNGDVQLTMVFD